MLQSICWKSLNYSIIKQQTYLVHELLSRDIKWEDCFSLNSQLNYFLTFYAWHRNSTIVPVL